jgi:molybdopterin converting factor small subunit
VVGKVRLELLSWLADTVRAAGDEPSTAFEIGPDEFRTVEDLLACVARDHAEFREKIFDSRTLMLNSAVAVFHNGKQIEFEDGLRTVLKAGDSIVLAPIVAGG